jgi:chemotaxis protein MotB
MKMPATPQAADYKLAKGEDLMKRMLIWTLGLGLIISLTGCAELKQLRVDNASLKTRVEQLDMENRTCQDALKNTRAMLQQREDELLAKAGELKKKESELKQKDVKVKEQSDAFSRMQEAMKAELSSKQVALKELEGKLTLTMVESILFDSGKADVKPEGIEALNKVADVLKNTSDQEVIVAGYTDNVPIGGALKKIYPSNWELSAARAISVVKILTERGVNPAILSASGFGEYRPVADNESPEGRAQNRRMEIVLMPKRK